MFKKVGDLTPITIIDPTELDDKATRRSLKTALSEVENLEKQGLAPVQKKLEIK